jgi:hypothetical protein
MTGPAERCWDLLASSDEFEAWIIAWPSGGAVELHDHGDSAGAVVVVAGALVETRIVPAADGTAGTSTHALPVGASVSFGRRHVHDIVNLGPGPATSVHVYAPRLTSMTYYRRDRDRLEVERTVRYHLGTEVGES